MPNLSTSSSSIGIILDISLHLDNLESSLNLEVLRWLKLLQVPCFECLGLADLLVEDIGLTQGRASREPVGSQQGASREPAGNQAGRR